MPDSMRTRMRAVIVACMLLVSCGGGSGSSGGVPPIDPPPPPPPPPPTEVALHSRTVNFGSGFQGVAVDRKRSLIYVSMRERNELLIIDADTYLEVDRFFVGPQPTAVALSEDQDRLYIALEFGGGIAIVDLATRQVRRVDAASAMGTRWISSLLEVSPGRVLLGGSSTDVPSRMVIVDVDNGGATEVAAGGQLVLAAAQLLWKPDRSAILVVDMVEGESGFLLKLDATTPGLPLLARAPTSSSNRMFEFSADGALLMDGGGTTFDAETLERIAPAFVDGSIGSREDHSEILRASGPLSLYAIDPDTLEPGTHYSTDCPTRLVTGVHPGLRAGEWMINLAGQVCVVATATPEDPPGVDADRMLPPWVIDPVPRPAVEVAADGGTDLELDEARDVAYIAIPMESRIEVMSLSQPAVVDSIAIPGEIRNIAMSDDGNRLYGSLADQGKVVSIDLDSRQVTASLDLATLLGTLTVGDVVEAAPGDLIVGANSPFGDVTYVVLASFADPSAAARIGCTEGYGGTALWKSPDARYLYVATNSLRCPLLEKRDLAQPGFPIVRASELGNSNTGADLGRHAMTSDGRHILGQGGDIISTETLWSLGLVTGSGQPMASSDPDRYYVSSFITVRTVSVHDFAVKNSVQFPCNSVGSGVAEARVTRDESRFLVLGRGSLFVDGSVCVVDVGQ
jgi:DNA-binding beta-propeller fold protein YncE